MKITIDLDAATIPGGEAYSTPSVPLPPPELLKRAKALGAISAGAANIGPRLPVTQIAEEPPVLERVPRKKVTKRPKQRPRN